MLMLSACAKDSGPGADLSEDQGQEDVDGPGEISRGEYVKSLPWATPSYTSHEEKQILDLYAGLDPNRVVPSNLLKKVVLYFHRNKDLISNHEYISVIDFSKSSKYRRFFLIHLPSGQVTRVHVAHGKNSDLNNDGIPERFSNRPGSEQSSLGFYLTWETYFGRNGYSLRMDGLSSTNSNARDRAVVIHGAAYVKDQNVKQGRSQGCPAFSMNNKDLMIDALKGGTLIYAGRSRLD